MARYNGNSTVVSIPRVIDNRPVTVIGVRAFRGCVDITHVVIPSTVRIIESYAFEGCTKLQSIKVSPNNRHFIFQDGLLYNSDKTRLLFILPDRLDVVILDTV